MKLIAVQSNIEINLSDYSGYIVVVFHYGKGHVRLQSQQLSVCVGESDYLVSGEKILVLSIQVIFFKFIHLVMDISEMFIKMSETEHVDVFSFKCLVTYHDHCGYAVYFFAGLSRYVYSIPRLLYYITLRQ